MQGKFIHSYYDVKCSGGVDSSAEIKGLFQLGKSSMGFIQSSDADR
ncbi:unnamed protein product, partial [Rotaria magnacalcarata]